MKNLYSLHADPKSLDKFHDLHTPDRPSLCWDYGRATGDWDDKMFAKNFTYAYEYARVIKKGRYELGEPAIAKDPDTAVQYAKLLNKPFKIGESTIAKYSYESLEYARDVLKGRFELGEPAIARMAMTSIDYARNVLKGRFKLGEPTILKSKSIKEMCDYAYAIGERFEEAEAMIAKDYFYARQYDKRFGTKLC